MRSALLIAANELHRMFKSPLAWVIIAVVQFLLSMFFYLLLSQYMQPTAGGAGITDTVVNGMYQIAGIVMLMVSPLLTMRLLTEERRQGTIKLLFSSPISITELVLGKYIGILSLYILMISLVTLMPMSLMFGTQLDWGQIATGLIGLFLLVASFAAIGLFISTITNQPATAAISTFGVLFVLWIINAAGSNASEGVAAIFAYLSLLMHYNNLLTGVFNSADVLFYCLVSIFFIVLSIWRLDAERTHG